MDNQHKNNPEQGPQNSADQLQRQLDRRAIKRRFLYIGEGVPLENLDRFMDEALRLSDTAYERMVAAGQFKGRVPRAA